MVFGKPVGPNACPSCGLQSSVPSGEKWIARQQDAYPCEIDPNVNKHIYTDDNNKNRSILLGFILYFLWYIFRI